MAKTTLLKAVLDQSRGWLYFISFLILVAVGLFIYQAQFLNNETERLQHQQKTLQKQLRAREAKLAESGVPVSDVERMETDLQKFSQLIPEKQKFADFIGELFDWAKQSQLSIRQVSYQPEIDKDTKFLNYGLSFSVQGRYAQLKKFIHLLENSNRLLIIDDITLAGRKQKDKAANVSLQIKLTTYFQEGER